jgi:hypothetical protein
MSVVQRRSLASGAVLLLVLLAAAMAPAAHAAGTLRSDGRTIVVDVRVDRFAATKDGRVVAHATATRSVRMRDGSLRTAGDKVTMAVSTGSNCKILTLSLQKLKLTLLGLTVDTSALNLHVTGDRTGTLGKLFCQLAAGLKLSNVTKTLRAVKSMNSRIAGHPMHAMTVRANIEPSATAAQAAPPAAPTCNVLSLTLGPLNLDLLGLYVDLYGPTAKSPVIVTITADPNGGALGKLFCQLAASGTT